MRQKTITMKRVTNETTIQIKLRLKGKGEAHVNTGIGFFDHMLSTCAKHGGFDLTLNAIGDLHIDQHHTVEDVGIALGEAFLQALGDKKGINRTGYFVFPMDESLSICAIDFGGRPYLEQRLKVNTKKIGGFETVNLPNFFAGFASGARANVHLVMLYGKDPHHKVEACFKAFGKALRMACSSDMAIKGTIPSTKGKL